MRRANHPLDPAAVQAANASLAAETGGRPLTMGPEDAALRKKWMDAYIAAAGPDSYTSTKARRTRPPSPVTSCPSEQNNYIELQYSYADGEGVPGASFEVTDVDTNGVVASGTLEDDGFCSVDIPSSTERVSVSYWNDPKILNVFPEEVATPDETTLQRLVNWVSEIENYSIEKPKKVLLWTWGSIQGDFNEDATMGQVFFGTGLTLIPGLDQVGDGRDLIANLKILIYEKRYNEKLPWIGLVLCCIGLIPTIGSAVKGISKVIVDANKTGRKLPINDLIKNFNFLAKGDASKFLKELSANFPKHGDFAKTKIKNILNEVIRLLNIAIKRAPQEYATKAERIKPIVEDVFDSVDTKVDMVVTDLRKSLDDTLEDTPNFSKTSGTRTLSETTQEVSTIPDMPPIPKLKIAIKAANPSLFRANYLNRIINHKEIYSSITKMTERGKKLPLQVAEQVTVTPIGVLGRGKSARQIVNIKTMEGEEFIFYRSSGVNEKTTGKKLGDWIPIPGWANMMKAEKDEAGNYILENGEKVYKEVKQWFIKMEGSDERYGVVAFQEIAEILHKSENEFMHLLPNL